METLLVTTKDFSIHYAMMNTRRPSFEELREFHWRCAYPLADLFRTARDNQDDFQFVFHNVNAEVLISGSIDKDGTVVLNDAGQYDFSGEQTVQKNETYDFDQKFPVKLEMLTPSGHFTRYLYLGTDEDERRKWCDEYGPQVRDEFYDQLDGMFKDKL